MRFVNIDELRPDHDWEARAARERGPIERGEKKADAVSAMWREFRDRLGALSSGKCFYCEARLTRASYDVDHFRPKSLYPFLSLTPRNFRLACQYCNRPRRNPATGEVEGKSDHFPLRPNSMRATSEADLDQEDPLLLDPCNAADPLLLGFLADGTACAAHPDEPSGADRVRESLRAYSLNEPRLIDARFLVAQRVADAVRNLKRTDGQQQVAARWQDISAYVKELQQCIRHDAEFAAFARAILRTHRGNRWVDKILEIS